MYNYRKNIIGICSIMFTVIKRENIKTTAVNLKIAQKIHIEQKVFKTKGLA